VALIVTAAISDGLSIEGFTTWFLAALVIWLASMVAALILKLTIAKKVINQVRD